MNKKKSLMIFISKKLDFFKKHYIWVCFTTSYFVRLKMDIAISQSLIRKRKDQFSLKLMSQKNNVNSIYNEKYFDQRPFRQQQIFRSK